jgi:hypothetical protein
MEETKEQVRDLSKVTVIGQEMNYNFIKFVHFKDEQGEGIVLGVPGRTDLYVCSTLEEVQGGVQQCYQRIKFGSDIYEQTMKAFENSPQGYWMTEAAKKQEA